jgi:RNA-directed DNA polymerase
LLTKSYYAKLLAVKKVISNKGSKTPGVDGEVWNNDVKRYKGALNLEGKGYKASPLRRTYIKKPNGKLRTLGIPTMHDRSMQALYAMALDPVAESILSTRAFGLWILDNVPMNKRILRQFLKAGFVHRKNLIPTENGTPQGGIISPILANLTLNGLAEMLEKKYSISPTGNISRQNNKNRIHTVVYADDFIITANNEETLHQVKRDIEEFLLVRGLELSESKMLIINIRDGSDFLGWNIRKYKTKLIITPSKKSVKRVCENIRETVRKNLMQKQEVLIKRLNAIIRGWCNHRSSCAKESFQTIDMYVFLCLWHWAKRRHANKNNLWRKNRYFVREGSRDWIFRTESVKLLFASDTKIKRHQLIRFVANPYLREYDEYYSKRRVAC